MWARDGDLELQMGGRQVPIGVVQIPGARAERQAGHLRRWLLSLCAW